MDELTKKVKKEEMTIEQSSSVFEHELPNQKQKMKEVEVKPVKILQKNDFEKKYDPNNNDNNFKEKSEKLKDKDSDHDVIDLTIIKEKLKGIFSNIKHNKKSSKAKTNERINPLKEEKEKSYEETDESIDLKAAINFSKKNSKWLIPVLFILVAILVSSHFRMMPSELPITDNWAEDSIQRAYRNQIASQVNNEYPNLPEQNREILINAEINKLIEGNEAEYKRSLNEVSQQYKSRLQDENGDTYLLAIDPYLWYSEARNVINHGHLGDKIIDGESYFSLRDGRLDKRASVQLNPYLGAYLYKFLKIFDRNISLMRAMFLLPVFLIALSLIPTFLIVRRLAGNVGGFFAAIFLAVNGALLSRTPGGFADTDPYNILFPVTIIWLFFESYITKSLKLRILYSALGGLFVGLYAAAWSGWSFAFLIVLGVILITAGIDVFKLIKKDKSVLEKIKNKIYIFTIFLVSSGVFVSSFESFRIFWRGFTRPIRFISLKTVGVKSIWPNVLTTVAEFNTRSFSEIISQAGSNLIFGGGMMGIVLLLVNRNKKDHFDIIYILSSIIYYVLMVGFKNNLNNPVFFIVVVSIPVIVGIVKVLYKNEKSSLVYPILILVWFCSTAYAYTKGVRFALLMVPAFSIALGTTFGITYEKFSLWLTRGMKINKNASRIMIFLVLSLFLLGPFSQAKSISLNEIPSMNDAWFNSLTNIKDASEKAIITSWWDFGHWFVAIAERMVTFDGGDQGERIHWVGRSLQTSDEMESLGILRMLNCAQEKPPHKLDEFTTNSLESIKILYEIFPISDRTLAYNKYLELGLTDSQATEMLELTHCEDLIDNYYITSEDMVGKSGVWGHFGSWDFEKATMYNNVNKLSRPKGVLYLQEKFDLEKLEADKIYTEIKTENPDRWIAPWPGFLTGVHGCDRVNQETIHCTTGLSGGQVTVVIGTNSLTAKLGNTNVTPNSLVYATPEGIKEKKFDGEKAGFSVVLIPNGDGYRFLLADPLQAAGIFSRMFFLDGHGLECFSKFDEAQQINGQRIVTWKVDFDCQQENNIYFGESEG